MESQQTRPPASGQTLTAGLMAVVRNMLCLALNRIELAALELSEVRGHFLKLLLVFAFGITAVWFALMYWTVLVVYLTWEILGWKILLFIAAGFTLLAAGLFSYARGMVANGKLSMPATMAELRGDRDALLQNDE
jgi:uncharacterized membrane protein YqjE